MTYERMGVKTEVKTTFMAVLTYIHTWNSPVGQSV